MDRHKKLDRHMVLGMMKHGELANWADLLEQRLYEALKHRDEWREYADAEGAFERGIIPHQPKKPADRLEWEGEDER
jgi:hypothetical protein